jgi:putative membrane protein
MRTGFRSAAVALGATAAVVLLPVSAGAQQEVSEQDRAFLVAAHQSNLAEIAAGEAAQQQATTDMVRQHGARFIADHTRLDADLTAVAGELAVELPDAPTAEQQAQLDQVKAQPGAAFDSAWTAQQITAHELSAANGEKELAEGTNDRVKALASAAAPVIASHLAMLQDGSMPGHSAAGTGGQAASGFNPLVAAGLLGLGLTVVLVTAIGLARTRHRTDASA